MKLPISPQTGDVYEASPNKYLQYDGNGWIRLRINVSETGYSRKLDQIKVNETPTGETDGVNRIFRLQHKIISETEQVYYNGLLCKNGEFNDYLISEDTIIFNQAPEEGTQISCTYTYSNLLEVINEIPKLDEDRHSLRLQYVPEPETIRVYLNGLLQKLGIDFSVELNKIFFINEISTNDSIIANYFYVI